MRTPSPREGKRKVSCVGKINRHRGLRATRMRTERTDQVADDNSNPSHPNGGNERSRQTGAVPDRGTRPPSHHSRRKTMNKIRSSPAIAAPGPTCGAAAIGDSATILPNASAEYSPPSRAGHAETEIRAPIVQRQRVPSARHATRSTSGVICRPGRGSYPRAVSRSRVVCAVICRRGVSAGAGHRNEVGSKTVVASGGASRGSCPHRDVGGQRPFRGVDLGQPIDRSAFAAVGCLHRVASFQPRTAPSPREARPWSVMGPSSVFRLAASVTRANAHGEWPSCSWGRVIVRNSPAGAATPGGGRQPERSVGFEGGEPSFPPTVRNLLPTPIEKVIL